MKPVFAFHQPQVKNQFTQTLFVCRNSPLKAVKCSERVLGIQRHKARLIRNLRTFQISAERDEVADVGFEPKSPGLHQAIPISKVSRKKVQGFGKRLSADYVGHMVGGPKCLACHLSYEQWGFGQHLFKLFDSNRTVNFIVKLQLGKRWHHQSFDAQSICSDAKIDQLAVSLFCPSVGFLHRRHGPRRGSDCEQTCNQSLKIKDDVPPRVPALLAFDLPRRSNQHWRNNRDYQHKSAQNLKSLLNARPHLNPRQRHLVEVSHFSRESGRVLQPNQVAANAVRDARLFWKGCAA
ncbi:hypothetical protein QE435_002220 [Rhizobium sp. SORGH_AS 787]|nr:hypothetical protein [Rhizobium sp. SORGH_AS_0787]